ncbi:zinc ribbon domain-containing protein [Kangiella sediminilitoris]|uniref:Zinc-ribbon domain-containing protein n=1 Tax=Kangiella sediminilitoris TaxID=1144748 RepID=A0A1B3BAB0_9GAMM|nr:zinc ribbon domain-containing protein [Kangiella sediminilitoris]AOE49725.1 hypothetical protein KS2013_1004 [Kangiella sediminilitoris]
MAIIQCIVCGKRISNKAESCSHCGAKLRGTTEEQLERAAHLQRLRKNRRLQSLSFIAVIAFAAGFLLKFFSPGDNVDIWEKVSLYLMAAGFLGYVVMRVWIMLNKRK